MSASAGLSKQESSLSGTRFGEIAMDFSFLEESIPYLSLTWLTLVYAVLVLVIGLAVAKLIVRFFKRGAGRAGLPQLAADFTSRLLGILLYVAVFLVFLSALGVNVDSVVLGMSAIIGLVLGLGMQDTVANLAAGVWIAFLRPFDKGDYVTVASESGTVREVGVMATELTSPDNKFITIPNKQVWGSSVVNFSRMPTRRVAVDFDISHQSDSAAALDAAMGLLRSHELILEEPAPAVMVTGLGDSSVKMQMRGWVNNSDFWSATWDLNAAIPKALADAGVEIPYPQLDVHVHNE